MKSKYAISISIMSLSLFFIFGFKNNPNTGTLYVKINHLKNNQGKVGIGLYNTSSGFPSKANSSMEQALIKIIDGKASYTFNNLNYGTYAISVIHDENNNGKMDKTFYGKPKEGFGISNNPKPKMGPPSFDQAKFNLNETKKVVTINMRYF